MTFREFLQLSEMWYSKGESGQERLTHKNTPAKLAGGKDLYNSPPKVGGSAGAAMPGKKMRKMKEDVGIGGAFAGGGQAGADPGFGQGPGGPMGTGLPFYDKKKKKKHDPDKTFGMSGPVLPKLSGTKEGRPSV